MDQGRCTRCPREANRHFAKPLQRAERGKAVATLVPVMPLQRSPGALERKRRRQEFIHWLRRGALRGGKIVDWTRDELYNREERADVA
jgi:antitoxin (DNA-binding transcriptional repressor) of toxin-antitoxin stability system